MSGVAGMPLPDVYLSPCGTLAAYRRHLRRGDPVDESCRQAVARAWEDRVAAGYKRPSRSRPRLTHLTAAGGKAPCGKRPRNVTGDRAEVTCGRCLVVLRRHEAKVAQEEFDAVLARQAAARGRRRAA